MLNEKNRDLYTGSGISNELKSTKKTAGKSVTNILRESKEIIKDLTEEKVYSGEPVANDKPDINHIETHKDNNDIKQKSHISKNILHTYKRDVEDLVKDQKISMMKVVAAESNKRAKLKKDGTLNLETFNNILKKKKDARFVIMASVLMVMLGATALFASYLVYSKHQQETDTAKKTSTNSTRKPIIFIEHRAHLDTDGRIPREIKTELARMVRGSRATLGSVTHILLERPIFDKETNTRTQLKEQISQQDLVKALGLSLSDEFIQSLGNPQKYMLGMHMNTDGNFPFIILTVDSYEDAYAAMADWEKSIERDLNPIFIVPGSPSGERTVSTLVIKNIVARTIRDDEKHVHILYSFLDKHTILITNNIYAMVEIARRYLVRKGNLPGHMQPDIIE